MTKKGFRSGTEIPVLRAVLLFVQMPCLRCKGNPAKGITTSIRAILATILLALTVSFSYAQSCINWQTILGEEAIDERATDISYNQSTESIWVCGYQTSPYQNGAINSKNAWLLQINQQGEVIADFVIKDSTEFVATSLVHQNQNIFVGGYYHTINNLNKKKAWLAMYNGDDIEWMVKNETLSETKDLIQLPSGDLVSTGYINFEDTLKKSLIIERWNNDGIVVWSKMYGGTKDEEGNALCRLDDDIIIVTGYTSSSGAVVSNPLGGRDVWLLSINLEDGSLLQEKTFGGSSNDVAIDMVILPNQEIAIMAESLSTNGDISNSIGSGDFWLLKIDTQWNMVWEKSYGGLGPDFPYTMEAFPNGNLLIAGATFSNDIDIPVNYGFLDSWLAKLDQTDGSVIWSKVIGGNDADEILALNIVDENQIITAGNTDSFDIQCKKETEKHGNQNVWLLGLDELLLNTNELIIKDEAWLHYTIKNFNLHLHNQHTKPINILIADINGKIYHNTTIKNQTVESINLSNWLNGIYMILYSIDGVTLKAEKIGLF